MKRILLIVAFVVGTFACSAWSADPLVVGIEPSTQDAWRALAAQFEASTGVPVKTQPITQNSIAQQVVLQAYQKSGKLHFVMLQTAWTSNLSRYLVDLTEIDSPLRAGGVNPVVVDGRTVGVPISFADGWFLAVTAWPTDRGPVVPFLIAVAGGSSTTATVAPTGVAPAKTTGPSFVPPGKLAVAQHNPKVDGALESLVAAAQSALSAAATSVLSALPATARAAVDHVAKGLGVPFSADTATVTVVLESRPGRTSTSNVAALSALGLKGSSVKASSSLIKVSVPISQLATLASQLTGVSFIRPPYTPHALGTPSQGVAAIGATAFHTAGFRGTGVKVAVIDLGFAGLSAAQTRGDLPAGAMQNDLTGTGLQSGISHGTAVAEIVADIAPDAQLHLIKIADEVDLDLAVTYCIDNGIDIINHSLGWYNTNNYDGTGAICDIARRAINAGILWVNAAGNEAQSHWEGAFIDGNGDGWHDQDITLYVSSGSPIILYMTWNEWPQSSTDYDLYLYDPNGAVAASSTKHQTGTEEPTELVQTTAAQSGTYRIRFQGAGSRNLEIYSLYQGLSPYVSSSSLLAPADLTEAVSVGAVNHATYTTGPQEPYSSQGPTNDGRTKPDLACPDNVATGTSPYTTFPGTSGAAPHAAGAAALLLSRQPTLSEPALRAQLLANTVSMGSANIYGQGRLSLQPPTAPNQAPTASFTFSPSSPTTGTTVSFNASASTDPDGSIVAYTWNFGDGVTGSGVTASHAYAVAGSYTVSLTVRDDDSATNSTTRTVTVAAVPNQAPTASFTFSPSSPTTGTTVSFNASASTDPDGSIVAYTWNFGDGVTGSGVTASHAYAVAGSYTVSLTVRDDDSATNSTTRTVTVAATPNQAPTASFTFSPSSPTTGTTVSFNASASTDPDGSIVAYTWNFGDGVTGSGVTASHAYAVAGSYTVSLTVRDDDSATNSTTRTVTVQTPLVADLTVASLTYSPSAPALGQSITFTVAVVNQGSAGAGQFRVLLDSGTSSTFVYVPQLGAGAGQSLTMTLPLASSSQTFTARADDLGQIAEASESNNTRSVTISAGTPPPTAEAGGPYTGTAGAPIAFNGYGSSGSITTYSWSFGDGTSAQGVAPSHAYSVPGTYTTTLTVFGPGGQSSDSASVSVTALTPPPTAEAGGPYTGTAGAPIAFNGYGSSGSITTYSWSFGDGTSAQGVAPSHAYSVPGTYTATLTVFGPGGQSSDSASVSVTAAQPALNATVALSKATYMIGESISITLTTNRTAYLYVCEVRADQRVLLIYPNRYQPNNRLQPGTMVLPGSGYSLRAAEPAGNETLYLFAATVPIPGFPTSFGSDFPVLSTSPTAFRDSVRATMASLVPDDDRVFRSTGFTIVAAPPTTGTLRVVTTPAGATVRLDGTSIGTSPLERTNIPTGQHTVQLSLAGYEVETRQVSIQAGATTNLTVTLTPLVTNQPPTASFSFSPASVAAGQTVVFNATASSDPDGAIASYAWTFGDGATATGSSPSHAYADAGSFTVTLTVRDDGGLSRSTSKTLAVTDDPAWVVLLLPAALAADWTDHALALDGDPKTGAIGPATRSQWTSYLFFDAPGGGIQCDGLRFRSTFAPPSVISAPGGRGGEPYVLKLSWQVSVRTETGWKLVYEGALAQGEWADVRFDTVAVTEIRFRARGDLRNTLDPKLLEVHLHDASL